METIFCPKSISPGHTLSAKSSISSQICNTQFLIPAKNAFAKLSSQQRARSRNARAQLVSFNAKRAVSIPFREGSFSGRDYVKEVERVVRLTMPDSSRIQYLGQSVWKVRLKPVTFFSVSATPYVEIKVFYEEQLQALRIKSNKLALEFIGFPTNIKDLNIQFSLQGELKSSSRIKNEAFFHGWVALGLKSDLPLPLSLIPQEMVAPVGDGILDRILAAMEGSLYAGIVRDYKTWVRENEKAVISLQSAPTNPI